MGYRLTPEERRIIEATKRAGEQLHASDTPAERREKVWRTVLILLGAFIALVAVATALLWFSTRY